MPGKYSHSQVLVDYSSRGIINLPHEQYAKYTSAGPSRPPSTKSNHPTYRSASAQAYTYRSPSTNGAAKVYSASNRSAGSVVTNSASTKPRIFLDLEDESELIGRKPARRNGSQQPQIPSPPSTALSIDGGRKVPGPYSTQHALANYQEDLLHTSTRPLAYAPETGAQVLVRSDGTHITNADASSSLPARFPSSKNQDTNEISKVRNAEPESSRTNSNATSKLAFDTTSAHFPGQALPQSSKQFGSRTAKSPNSTREERIRNAKQAEILKHQARVRENIVSPVIRSDSMQTAETQIFDPPKSPDGPDFDGFSDIAPTADTYFDRSFNNGTGHQNMSEDELLHNPRQLKSIFSQESYTGQMIDGDNHDPTLGHSLFISNDRYNFHARQSTGGKFETEARQPDLVPVARSKVHQQHVSDGSPKAKIDQHRSKVAGKSAQNGMRTSVHSPSKSTTTVPERNVPSRTTSASIAGSNQTGSLTSLSSTSSFGGVANGHRSRTNDVAKDSMMQTHHEKRWGLPEIQEDPDFSSTVFGEDYVKALEDISSSNDISAFGHISSGRDVTFDNDDAASDLSAACPPNISRWRPDETDFPVNMSRVSSDRDTASSKKLVRPDLPVSKKKGFFSRLKLRG